MLLLVAIVAIAGCGDEGGDGGSGGAAGTGGSGGSAGTGGGFGNFGFISSVEGSNLTLRHPDGTEESIGGEVLFGWNNGQLLNGNYFKQLRIGTSIGVMELKMSFPGDTPSTGLIEGPHTLRGTRLLLEQTQALDSVQVEVFFQSSDPPFDGLTNATGAVEMRLDVTAPLQVYDIVGEIDAEIRGVDGSYGLSGYFWAEVVDP